VVATDVGGAREAIVAGETGFTVPSGDDETMAARIETLVRDRARASAMGERGRQVAVQKFSAEAQLAATEQLYDQALNRQASENVKRTKVLSDFETIS